MMQFMQRSAGASPSTKLSFRDMVYRKLIGDALNDTLVKATTDRLHAKTFIDGRLVKRAAIPTLAVLRTDDDIEQFSFEPGTMVRTTHSYVVPAIISEVGTPPRVQFKEWLAQDYYYDTRELNYKGLQPGLLIEPYEKEGTAPVPLIAFCYAGQVSLVHTLEFRGAQRLRRFYTPEWEPMEFSIWDPLSPVIDKPKNLAAFIEDCNTLSEPFEIVAVEALVYPDGSYVFTAFSHCPDGNGAWILPHSATQEFNARFFRTPPYGDTDPEA